MGVVGRISAWWQSYLTADHFVMEDVLSVSARIAGKLRLVSTSARRRTRTVRPVDHVVSSLSNVVERGKQKEEASRKQRPSDRPLDHPLRCSRCRLCPCCLHLSGYPDVRDQIALQDYSCGLPSSGQAVFVNLAPMLNGRAASVLGYVGVDFHPLRTCVAFVRKVLLRSHGASILR